MRTFITEYRVTYGDSDPFDVVYYANYLTIFERGRTELFRELGLTYREVQNKGIFLPVSETYCKYHKPARYDDLVVIETRIVFLKRVSIKFEYALYEKQGRELLAEGYTIHAFVNREGKILRVPKEISDKIRDLVETN
jgi:acyl-CoA thioester hydrolase